MTPIVFSVSSWTLTMICFITLMHVSIWSHLPLFVRKKKSHFLSCIKLFFLGLRRRICTNYNYEPSILAQCGILINQIKFILLELFYRPPKKKEGSELKIHRQAQPPGHKRQEQIFNELRNIHEFVKPSEEI